MTLFISIGTWRTRLTTSVHVEMMDCAQFLALLWLQYRFVERWKGRPCKEFERKKEWNEAEHGESAIDGMHVLNIPLGSVDSVLYSVFTPDCKQCTGFFALPILSNHSQHTLNVIESRESTPNDWWSGSKPHREVDWLKPVWNWFDWNRFKCRRNESGSIRIESGSKLDYFASVEGPLFPYHV